MASAPIPSDGVGALGVKAHGVAAPIKTPKTPVALGKPREGPGRPGKARRKTEFTQRYGASPWCC